MLNEFSLNAEMERLRNYDYFQKTDAIMEYDSEIESVKAWGSYSERIPLVSILITTYKRPGTLRGALSSAIDQKGFHDYEIVVVDNEGEDINIKTETQKLIEEFSCDKVIYYRNIQSVAGRADRAILLARTEWVCILHDDDILAENHLQVMIGEMQKNRDINYLACALQSFRDDEYQYEELHKECNTDYEVLKLKQRNYTFRFIGGWLGALIRRKNYLNMGGMSSLRSEIGDYIMAAKFAYYFGTYQCTAHSYRYRIWNNQLSSGDGKYYARLYALEHFFNCYMARKYVKLPSFLRKRLCEYMTIHKVEAIETGVRKVKVDKELFYQLSGCATVKIGGVADRLFMYYFYLHHDGIVGAFANKFQLLKNTIYRSNH